MVDDLTDLRNDVAAVRRESAEIRARVDGLPLLAKAVDILQRDARQVRDDITVLTGIAIGLEGAMSGLTQELRGIHSQFAHMNERVRKLEDAE